MMAKQAAMDAKYPGKNLIIREIVDSPKRLAPPPDVVEGEATSYCGRAC
jgi:hypothetical protein